MRVFVCETCKNQIELIKDLKGKLVCCGNEMKELIPGTSDGAREKHVPTFKIEGNKVIVNVGEVAHPMIDVHYIEWVAIETKLGIQRINLKPNQNPTATFILPEGDELIEVYAYCNLHGLWKANI